MRLTKITFKKPEYLYNFLLKLGEDHRIMHNWEMRLPYDVVYLYKENKLIKVDVYPCVEQVVCMDFWD